MRHEDFAVIIQSVRGAFKALVLSSPAGEDDAFLDGPALEQAKTLQAAFRQAVRTGEAAVAEEKARALGEALFEALFTRKIRFLFHQSLERIDTRLDCGLHIKLQWDPEDFELLPLTALPWELLYDPDRKAFLNQEEDTPVIRHLRVPKPPEPLPFEPPLRILVAMANPQDTFPLNLKRERALIEQSIARQDGVEVHVVEQAGTKNVQAALAERPYHVFHFMGHGSDGVLRMEEGGKTEEVDGRQLGELFRQHPTLRLVFLNACETAQTDAATPRIAQPLLPERGFVPFPMEVGGALAPDLTAPWAQPEAFAADPSAPWMQAGAFAPDAAAPWALAAARGPARPRGTATRTQAPADPFSGVATALVKEGVSAVVAMQFSISDAAALAFSEQFYQRLMLGDPVHVAVNVGRTAIDNAAESKPLEWTTPVLFMRSRDGVLLSRKVVPPVLAEHRDLQILMREVKHYWVEGVLQASLLAGELIDLGMERKRDFVLNPSGNLAPDRSGLCLAKIGQVFDQSSSFSPALLIVGDPGSGKTTALLALARALLPRAQANLDQPVPVVLDLATWTDARQPMTDWLVDELGAKYRIPATLARDWVMERRLVLLLDGLDAFDEVRRAACVRAINAFLNDVGAAGIAANCRHDEYEALIEEDARLKLNFADAVCLLPLTPQQIDHYLDCEGESLAGLREALKKDAVLGEQAQSPLTLTVMSEAYRDVAAETLTSEGLDAEERRAHLFGAYIDRMFDECAPQTKPPYTRKQTTGALVWLARRMTALKQNLFLIERLQASWLATTWQRRFNLALLSVVFGLILGGIAFAAWYLSIRLIPPLPCYPQTDPACNLSGVTFAESPFQASRTQIPIPLPYLFWWIASTVWLLIVGGIGSLRLPWLTRSFDDRKGQVYRKIAARLLVYFAAWALVCAALLAVFAMDDLTQALSTVRDPLLIGLIIVVIYTAKVGLRDDIGTVEALGWSWKTALRGLAMGLGLGLFVWIGYAALNMEFGWSHLSKNLGLYLPLGVVGGSIVGGLGVRFVKMKTVPNQGIQLSIRNSLLAGAIVAPIMMITMGAIFYFIAPDFANEAYHQIPEPAYGVLKAGYGKAYVLMGAFWFGCLFALIAVLWFGGFDVLRHYALRLVIRATRQAPAQLVRFLDYAASLGLLQKAGGGYLFANRLLQAHFAARDADAPDGEKEKV